MRDEARVGADGVRLSGLARLLRPRCDGLAVLDAAGLPRSLRPAPTRSRASRILLLASMLRSLWSKGIDAIVRMVGYHGDSTTVIFDYNPKIWVNFCTIRTVCCRVLFNEDTVASC